MLALLILLALLAGLGLGVAAGLAAAERRVRWAHRQKERDLAIAHAALERAEMRADSLVDRIMHMEGRTWTQPPPLPSPAEQDAADRAGLQIIDPTTAIDGLPALPLDELIRR